MISEGRAFAPSPMGLGTPFMRFFSRGAFLIPSGTSSGSGNSVDVKGNRVAVKGNRAYVKRNSVDVKGNSVDVKGNSVD
eukprot:51807-Pyramimonas_sp.AAC.1